MGRCFAAAAIAAVVLGAEVDVALANGPVRIVSPRADSAHVGKRVTVQVRVAGRVSRLGVFVRHGRRVDASRRFHRRGRGVWAGRLRVGRELSSGDNHVYVRVRRPSGRTAYDITRFTVAHRRADLLGMRRVRRRARSPLHIRVRVDDGSRLRARLNGRRVSGRFERAGAGRRVAELAAHHGLRFGPNRLTLTALDARGRVERTTRRFRIRRDRPMVGAGRDRVTREGSPVRLDGRSTRAARRDAQPRLRWRIVSRPRGSRARLRGVRGTRPRLRPDRPGRYVVELRATARRRGAGAAALPAAQDSVTVTAQPSHLPAGLPIETIVDRDNPGVKVGDTFYAMPLPDHDPGVSGVQLLVLDRQTLVERSNRSFLSTVNGIDELQQAVDGLSSNDLVILSGNATNQLADIPATPQQLAEVVTGLGALEPASWSQNAVASSEWSLIGVPGLPAGQAYQFVGLQRGPGAPVGGITGFLRLDSSGNYAFAWPSEYIPFDTEAPGSTGDQSVMTVGAQRYIGERMETGFPVLWFDADTLRLRGQFNFSMHDTNPASPTSWKRFGPTLVQILGDPKPALLVVGSTGFPGIGKGSGTWEGSAAIQGDLPHYAELAEAITRFGANQTVFLGLDNKGGYGLVGNSEQARLEGPNTGAEVSQTLIGAPPPVHAAQVTGMLRRNRQGIYEPSETAQLQGQVSVEELYSVQRVLAQPEQPFEPFTGAEAAAERYIANQLGLELDPTYGIRALYWTNTSIRWDDMHTDLANPDIVPPCSQAPCTPQAFKAVKQRLVGEFQDVDTVRGFIGSSNSQLDTLYTEAFTESGVNFASVGLDLLHTFNPPPKPARGPNVFGIVEGVLGIANGIGGAIPVVGGAVGAGPEVAQGVLQIVQASMNDSSGASLNPKTAYEENVYNVGSALVSNWTATIKGFGQAANLLVSDAGRLSAAAKLIDTPAAAGGWGMSDDTQGQLTAALRKNAQQYIWYMLLPSVERVYYFSNDRVPRRTSGIPFQTSVPFYLSEGHPYALGSLPIGLATPAPSGQLLDAATASTLFDTLGLHPEYLMAPAIIDPSSHAPKTPGFVRQNWFFWPFPQPEGIWTDDPYGPMPDYAANGPRPPGAG